MEEKDAFLTTTVRKISAICVCTCTAHMYVEQKIFFTSPHIIRMCTVIWGYDDRTGG